MTFVCVYYYTKLTVLICLIVVPCIVSFQPPKKITLANKTLKRYNDKS